MKTLTVKQLINQLGRLPKDYQVYLSIDSEGNGFSTLDVDGDNFTVSNPDKAVLIYHYEEGLSEEDLIPKLLSEE